MQLDAEMSFVDQDDVHAAIGNAVIAAARSAGQDPGEIEKMTWLEAMNRFGVDKPDLRFGMELTELTDAFAATEFKAFAGAGYIKGINAAGKAEEYGRNKLDGLTDAAKQLGAKGLVWLKVAADGTLESPVVKFLSEGEQAELRTRLDAHPGDLPLIVADEWQTTRGARQLRNDLASAGARGRTYVDRPRCSSVDAVTGRPKPGHHPFTHASRGRTCWTADARSQAYDPCSTVAGPSDPDPSARLQTDLELLDREEEPYRSSDFPQPVRYGAPPQWRVRVLGIDRLVAILAGEENIREVITEDTERHRPDDERSPRGGQLDGRSAPPRVD
jgi:aspartyl-tRNA synthetase